MNDWSVWWRPQLSQLMTGSCNEWLISVRKVSGFHDVCRLLGKLASHMCQPEIPLPPGMEPPALSLGKLCVFHLNTRSALQRLAIAQVVYHWAQQPLVSLTDVWECTEIILNVHGLLRLSRSEYEYAYCKNTAVGNSFYLNNLCELKWCWFGFWCHTKCRCTVIFDLLSARVYKPHPLFF